MSIARKIESVQKDPQRNSNVERESARKLEEKWRNTHNSILDIGCDMDKLESESTEYKFYHLQLTSREGRVTDQVDEEYIAQEQSTNLAMEDEHEGISETPDDESRDPNEVVDLSRSDMDSLNASSVSISINRSGKLRISTDIDHPTSSTPLRPKLRVNRRICTDAIKSACATISSTCGISAEMSRKVVQIVSKELYGHQFYLSKEDQARGEVCTPGDLSYVIPSARTIADHKHLMAIDSEVDAAIALCNKIPSVKAFLHFDTTNRNNIDEDWPTIILRMSDGQEFRLRPLFFAFEDREQITSLFVETLTRLAEAASIFNQSICQASTLWENICALMTDAVTKNLEVEKSIAAKLNSDHIPLHLLCKSHTVEAIDKACLKVLSSIEKEVKQQEIFESINPALKSFFRGKMAVVEAGIEAILKLVTHQKSAISSSQADQFDRLCEQEGVTKRIFLYQQRRFAKIGKAAACILNAKDIILMLLDEIDTTNQLTEACRIYMSSDLFLAELECLAYFNHVVTFPFLNCVEVSSQEELLKIIPTLYTDLKQAKTDTLSKFVCRIRQMPTPTLTTDLSQEVIKRLCMATAEAIKLQCGREYGFSDLSGKERATNLATLTIEQLQHLPTNNCISERDLAKFDREASGARSRNRKFKAKAIRNNMVLYKSKKSRKIDRVSRKISSVLSARELEWDSNQRDKFKERLELKVTKAEKAAGFVKKLLQECKTWGGPATTVDELFSILTGKDNQYHILRTEVSYYAHTNKAQRVTNKELYRVNGISYEDMLENLTILLDEEENSSIIPISSLPTISDVLKALASSSDTVPNQQTSMETTVNDMVAVIWQSKEGTFEWYLGYVKKQVNGNLIIDHLHRCIKNSHSKWKYPEKEDIQMVEPAQIITCKIIGEWDLSTTRKRNYILDNIKTVSNAFTMHCLAD